MRNIYIFITVLTFISCDLGDNYSGFVQDNDAKSDIVVKLADSYLAGNFDIARGLQLTFFNLQRHQA